MNTEPTLTLGHLIIPILGLLIPIIAIVAHYGAKAYADRQRHLTIREFARAGQPVPPELLADPQAGGATHDAKTRHGPPRTLLPGVINIGLGLGLIGLFWVVSPGLWLWAIGLLPLGLGLSLVVFSAMTRQQQPGA